MTPDELRNILTAAGVKCRVKGDEVLVQTCPYCGSDRWNLEINAVNGFAKCWVCKQPRPGRADVALADLTGQRHDIKTSAARDKKQPPLQSGDHPQDFKTLPIADVPSAADYLSRRGYTSDVVREFSLSVCIEEGHQLYGRIVIPIRDYWTGNVLGWTGRSYTGGWPKYLSMLPMMQVTGWRAPGRTTPAVVVEGHLDGIAVRRAGFSAAVLGGSSINDLSEWSARLLSEQWAVVMLDGDAPEAANRLYWNIAAVRGTARLGLVTLAPEADPAGLGPEAVRRYVLASIRALDSTSQDDEVLSTSDS